MQTSVSFMRATPGDMDSLYNMAVKLFPHTVGPERRKEWIRHEPRGHYLMKHADGRVVAYLYLLKNWSSNQDSLQRDLLSLNLLPKPDRQRIMRKKVATKGHREEGMGSKPIRIQVFILFLLILANFIAQIPYYFHLYYNPNNLLAQLKGGLLMFVVFVVFLLASLLLFKRKALGYWLMVGFVAVEFLFYLWNTIGGVIHGYGPLFHLTHHDLLLKIVFAIGDVNFVASGYFLSLLLMKRAHFFESHKREKPLMKYSV